jgi:hypothetical protein
VTQNKTLKRQVRSRMSKTGERYTAARHQVLAKAGDNGPAQPLHGPTDRPLDAWFALLDQRGASDWKHRDIAVFLSEEGVPPWWTQDITVRYEKRIGRRVLGQRGSTFSATATKTIACSWAVAFDAWLDDASRAEWLPSVKLRLRTSKKGKYPSARFDALDGDGRILVSFDAKGEARTVVAIEHEKLPDQESASRWSAFWRERLAALKTHLES